MTEPTVEGVPLRDYLEAMFAADRRERDIAAVEREKAASTLREEQNRALSQAAAEREKAAAALRVGDAAAVQVRFKAVDDALRAQEQLSDEKEKRLEAVREADQVAVDKAFAAQETLGEKHNDLIRLGERKEATYATKKEIEDALGQHVSLVDLRFAELARERAGLVVRFDEFRTAMASDSGKRVTRELFDEHQANLLSRFDGFTERIGTRLERVETDLHRKEGGEQAAKQSVEKQNITIGQVFALLMFVVALVTIGIGAFT